jgi:hypothetical protein
MCAKKCDRAAGFLENAAKTSRGPAGMALRRVEFQGSWEEWDRIGSEFSDFTVNQSYGWGEGRRADGWSVSRHLWLDGDERVVALATALGRRVRGLWLQYISRGPVVLKDGVSHEAAQESFSACIASYRAALRWGDVLVCVLYQSPGQITPEAIAESRLVPLFPSDGDYAFSAIVHLKERDTLLLGASSDWRKLFRRSSSLLEQVKTSDDCAMFLRARDLVARLETEKGFTTNLTPNLIRAVGKQGARLFYVESESGEMLACLLVVLCGRRASRFLAGVSPDEARVHRGIGRVLEVAASRWAFDSGVYDYDLEGISPLHPGVSDFKRGMRGEMFAPSGSHVLSRPAILGRLYSASKRRRWSLALDLWRSSRTFFLQLYLRRLSGRLVAWEDLRIYRRSLDDKVTGKERPGYKLVCCDRFEPADFGYRFSTVRHLWHRMRLLKPESLEFCALVDDYGLVVAYSFLSWNRATIPEIDTVLPLDDGEVYINDCVVLRRHRGKRLYPYMLDQIGHRLKLRGFRTALIAANPANRPSCRGIEGCGFHIDRSFRYRRVGPWKATRSDSAPSPGNA